MTKVKTTLLALATALPLLTLSVSSQATMSPHMETALTNVCKAAISNSVMKLNRTTKEYRLNNKTVALKLMCNGEDVITFAEHYGADKTAAKLQESMGNVSITDVAALSKMNVSF